MSIDKKITTWTDKGLISPTQASTIRDYEATQSNHSWIVSGLLILGALVIGIGIISLIAANWDSIPDAVKLGFDFAILIFLSIWIVKSWEKNKDITVDVLTFFMMIFCLASIGLFAQIFQTGGKLYEALLIWCLITVGLVYIPKAFFVPFCWLGGFLTTLCLLSVQSPAIRPYFENFTFLYLMIPLLCAVIAMIHRKIYGETSITKALQAWIIVSGIIGVFGSEVAESLSRAEPNVVTMAFAYGLAVLVILGIMFGHLYRKMQKVILITTLIFFIVCFQIYDAKVLHGVVEILTLLGLAIFFADLKQRRIFNVLLLAVAIRFIVLYFQAFGGLAKTGIGLIISGLLVIGITIAWSKYRNHLAKWAEGILR